MKNSTESNEAMEKLGWFPIEYTDLVELITTEAPIVVTSKGMQLYFKNEDVSELSTDK